MTKMESSLPPDEENVWLNYLYNFEKSFAENKPIKVYDLIGKPDFKPLEQLREDEVEAELDRLIDIMERNNIVLDLLCEYEDKLIYKFVTEELFQKETSVIQMEGMKAHFLYEEFHPNHEYDIKEDIESLFESILTLDKDHRYLEFLISDPVEFYNNQLSREEFLKEIDNLKKEVCPCGVELLEFNEVVFDLEKRCGNAKGEINFSVNDGKAQVSGEFSVNVILNEFGFWEIKKIIFPEIK